MDEFDLSVFNDLVDEILETSDSRTSRETTLLETRRERDEETIRQEQVRLLSPTNPELLKPLPRKYNIFPCVDYFLRCENRRKVYFSQNIVYCARLRFGCRSRYFLVHEGCQHRQPILQLNENHPGVPCIYTSIYWPKHNGIYRNAIGEILEGIEKQKLPNVEPVYRSFIARDVRFKELRDDLDNYRKLVKNDAWTTPLSEVMTIYRPSVYVDSDSE